MSYTILIVDDSKLARMAVAKAMSAVRPDWTRIEAANAQEALDHAKSSAFDVALLDFNMPERDGLQLAGDLLAMRPGTPIAILSANHQKEIVERSQQLGAVFLPKPLTEAALRAFVEAVEPTLKVSH